MQRFYYQGYTKVPFTKIVKETDKAMLFNIISDVNIWIPKTWIVKMNKRSFIVKDHVSLEIKLKIKAEMSIKN